MAATRNKYGLTPKQEAFTVNYALKSMTKADAYRLAYKPRRMTDKQVYEEACKLSKHPKVLQRTNDLLGEMQVDDIVSSQNILRFMLDTAEQAKAQGLPGVAVQAGDRLMRHKALMADRIISSREGPGLDQDIVKALAGGDPRKERQLRAIIGSDDAFAPLEVVEEEDSTSTVLTEPDKTADQAK